MLLMELYLQIRQANLSSILHFIQELKPRGGCGNTSFTGSLANCRILGFIRQLSEKIF